LGCHEADEPEVQRMSPLTHYLRGLRYGGFIYFGGFFAFMAACVIPGPAGLPPVFAGVHRLAWLGLPGWLGFPALFFVAFGLSVVAGELVRWAFRRMVPACCPQCGGAAYGRGRWPVLYICRDCGHSHDTGIREGEEA
jgi:hypothetical protein